MSKIKLFFHVRENKELYAKIKNPKIIRLKTILKIKLKQGQIEKYYATIDTGAHTSVLPLSVWKNMEYKKVCEHKMSGIIKNNEWFIPVDVGKIKCSLLDEFGNETKEVEIVAFLAHTDNVSLVLGFNGLLENINLFVSYKTNTAYAEC